MKTSPYTDPDMAAVYGRIAVPYQFGPPARDLVRMVRPPDGARVLDVGTGTGAVAVPAIEATGSSGLVVGVDAAFEMLHVARRAASYPVTVAHVPGLPFRDGTFDVVTAGFVISHISNDDRALEDLVRVCRVHGRVGMSAWGAMSNAAAQLWSDIAAAFVPRERLDEAFHAHLPRDAWFSNPANIRRALADAGLAPVVVDTREYDFTMTTTDFLSARAASIQGMLVRDALSAGKRIGFTRQLADAFHTRFGEAVEYRRDVHFGIGTKPAR